jgi:hypothetical protein
LGSAKYNAVSYHWGDNNELETVRIHGSDKGEPGRVYLVPVTKSSTAALRQFRLKACVDKEPLRLWIDALCINQTDAAERGLQVLIMGYIFFFAASVWIWLGESDELVERGLATLFGQTHSYDLHRRTGAALPPSHFLSTTLSLDEEVLHIRQFAAVWALPYWRRGWTFQENKPPHRYIFFGKLMIKVPEWSRVFTASFLYAGRLGAKLGTEEFSRSIVPLLSDAEYKFARGETMIDVFVPFAFAEQRSWTDGANTEDHSKHRANADEYTGQTVRPFNDIGIFKAYFFQKVLYRTSDPRDSVFALRKIIPELANMKPNYSSTPERIFTIATETYLRNTRGGLGDLHQWFHPQASSQLPSWVFDFTHCNVDVNENGGTVFLKLQTIRESDASAGSPFRVAHCNGISMHVTGFVFDEILDITGFIDYSLRPGNRWMAQVNVCLSLADSYCLPSITSIQGYATYTRALIRTFGIGVSDLTTNTIGLDEYLRSDLFHWEDGPIQVLTIISTMSRPGVNAVEFERAKTFLSALSSNLSNARFFVSKSLRIGLAPMGAAVGDQIAIIASADLPFVLRPVPEDYAGEEAYRIMGGCYVDGIVT